MAYNEAQKRATMKYQKENLEQIAIRVPKGDRANLKEAAEEAGESMALYIINSVNTRAGREVLTVPGSKPYPQQPDELPDLDPLADLEE